MRSYRSMSFTRSHHRIAEPSVPIEPVVETPITSDFTPGQTLALLRMRDSELALAVLGTLSNGTAHDTLEDYTDLTTLGYARRLADSGHKLTPHGHFKANALAKALAVQLGIPIERHEGGLTRNSYQPGVRARFNHW